MLLDEFDYDLPPERIAQHPLAARDASRMLWLDRATGGLQDCRFLDLPGLLRPGDLLVANDSRVLPVRLLGQLAAAGEATVAAELLLLAPGAAGEWTALARPARRLPPGTRVELEPGGAATILERGERGACRVRLEVPGDAEAWLERHGHIPLPPYIRRPDSLGDRERYQTVYARAPGAGAGFSAAAPTAGLHFTTRVLEQLGARGVGWTTVALDVGLGTFQPVSSPEIERHPMHAERYAIGPEAAAALNHARAEGRRIVAVGTTAARVLETAAPDDPRLPFAASSGLTRLYLYPGGRGFRALGAILTNFHAPRTTLLMMIAAFAGLEPVRRAYQHALDHGYRFLSYGDCMLIT
ncbi:MAG: tRNA preQ1(34) S-adenosylmethionine ribosyltransferase-isomerase QueA [Terriglobales bacterium]